MGAQIRELKQSWQPEDADDYFIPTLGQQRADAFVLLFLGKNKGRPKVYAASHEAQPWP